MRSTFARNVACGSWLCKNAATRDDDRINLLPKRVWVLEDWRARLVLAESRKVILVASQLFEFLHSLGHSRPIHLVPVPIKVRCYSNSDIIIRRGQVTLRAMCGRLRVGKDFLYECRLVGAAMCSAFECGSHDRWP